MTLLDSIKPFWPLLFTFVLPRAYGYYQELKTAYRTRPPAKTLPPLVNRSLNILFCAVIFFFVQSFRTSHPRDTLNVFKATGTRITVPSDTLFTRLALQRTTGTLSETEEQLRHVLITKDARLLYLTYGPDTLLNCSFCHPSQPHTYALYHIPTNVLLPHFLHLLVLGLATSGSLTTASVSRLRTRLIAPALAFAVVDVALNAFKDTLINTQQVPLSPFVTLRLVRLLGFCFMDALFAFYIWSLSTGRFLFFPFLSDPNANADIPALQTQTQQLVTQSNGLLQATQAKLRAYAVASNTVVRDPSLKAVEDTYWAEVRRREGTVVDARGQTIHIDDGVYQSEEVQAAIARAYGGGSMDVPRARREAGAFVNAITQGLER